MRHVKTRDKFAKEGKQFTKNVFVVKERVGNRYILLKGDRELETRYRDYELQVVVGDVHAPPESRELPPEGIKARKADFKGFKKQRRTHNLLKREGQNPENIVDTKRVRKPKQKLNL